MFRDDTTNLDHHDTIPMEVEWGRDNFGVGQRKNYHSVVTDADQAAGTLIKASVDGGQFKDLGQLTEKVEEFSFKYGTSGFDINFKYTHNDDGPGPILNGQQTFWSPLESLGAAG